MTANDPAPVNYELRDPDVRLMLEVRNDNPAAFEELVVRYQARLVHVLTHLVGDAELAQDLAQDVFLRVYRARKKYQPGSKFATWLFTIANNVARNARRSQSRRREVQLVSAGTSSTTAFPVDQVAQAASGLMPTRQLDRAEMRDIVRQALLSLNERQRLAVLLNKFEGMAYAEIATAMDLSPQAVKSLLTRARNVLRDVLEPYLDDGRRPVV